MPFELHTDTPAELMPLSWLIGVWAGVGVAGYPTMPHDLQFGQEVEFSHNGQPYLSYSSHSWLLDDDGQRTRTLASETGYWRPAGPAPTGGTELEVLLTHPSGILELYLGTIDGPRVTLTTDMVARTSTAKEYTAASRMYGMVETDLLWVMEMAALGQPMTPHVSARLKRVPS